MRYGGRFHFGAMFGILLGFGLVGCGGGGSSEGGYTRINSVAFAPDGKSIVTGFMRAQKGDLISTGYLNAFSLPDGKRLWENKNVDPAVYTVVVSPDSASVVSGSYDRIMRLWDAKTGALKWKIYTNALTMTFSPNGKFIGTAGRNDHTYKVWDAATGADKGILAETTADPADLAFALDGTILAGIEGNVVRLYDTSNGQVKATLSGHTDTIAAIAVSPDGKMLASASHDHTVRLWSLPGGQLMRVLAGHTDEVHSVAFSPDSTTLVSGGKDNIAVVWDAQSGLHKLTLTGASARVESVAYSPDGKTIATGSWDGGIRLYDATTGASLKTL